MILYSDVNKRRCRMGVIGVMISLVAALFLLVGLIPFLGWLNWFTTLPASVLGAIVGGVATSRSKSRTALTGLIISLAVFAVAILRLAIGGGFI
jgi:hypothetical protein